MKLSLHELPTTMYPNRLSSPARPEPVEGSIENPTLAHFRHFSSLFTNFPFTTVEKPLQISLFMQNKANFQKSQMNVNKAITRDYENETLGKRGKNKPNTNPIQSQTNPISEKAKMNVTSIITKGYENKPRFRAKAKQTQYKPNQTQPVVSLSNLFQRQKNA
ncbi:unnamed protein product, partial [marine sediment metagenome]